MIALFGAPGAAICGLKMKIPVTLKGGLLLPNGENLLYGEMLFGIIKDKCREDDLINR